jgi:hypothetical protein
VQKSAPFYIFYQTQKWAVIPGRLSVLSYPQFSIQKDEDCPIFFTHPATKGDLKANLFAVEGDLRALWDAVFEATQKSLRPHHCPDVIWGFPMVSIVKLPPIAGGFISWKIQQKSHMLHGAGIFTNIYPINHPVM